jgi:methionine-R-sulfoxide reductase
MLRLLLAFSAGLALFACGAEPPTRSASVKEAPMNNASPAASSSGETVARTDAEWKKILTPEQYRVLRQKGTERPFTGEYDATFEPGTYACAACGLELFPSDTKFDSNCGWPAFYAAKAGDRVVLTADDSFGMHRVEVTCARCGSHLGHVFDGETHVIDGQEKVVSRYCINSVSLKFIPAPKPATRPR